MNLYQNILNYEAKEIVDKLKLLQDNPNELQDIIDDFIEELRDITTFI